MRTFFTFLGALLLSLVVAMVAAHQLAMQFRASEEFILVLMAIPAFVPISLIAFIIAYPLVFSSPFQQRLGALVLLYAIMASSWNIVGGYAGQVSVGHVVFFGCGAYAAMGAYAHFGLPPVVGIPGGIVLAVAIAAIVGVPTLRLSGHYFSMATIAVAELIRLVVTNIDYLGAAVGLSGPTVPRNIFDLSFISALPYYYLFLAVLVLTLLITWWMANSRMGFYLRAIRDSERAARSLGAPETGAIRAIPPGDILVT